jgi:hypothetical protein
MTEHSKDPASTGGMILELVDLLDQSRVLQREISHLNSRVQIQFLMKRRQDLLSKAKSLGDELERRIPGIDRVQLRVFQTIYHALEIYGHGVTKSILMSFQYETGFLPIDVVNQPRAFYKCIEKVLGKKPSKKVEQTILMELSHEFEMQLSRKSNLGDALRMAITIMRQQNPLEGVGSSSSGAQLRQQADGRR